MNKIKKMTRSILTLALSVILCVCLIPTKVAGAEPVDIDVYVTISDSGYFAATPTGEDIAYKKITLTGQSGYTVSDVLKKVHDEYYPGGAAAGYAENTYGWATMFWGTTGTYGAPCGYYVNNASAGGTTDPVNDGDHVYAFLYLDTSTYTDKYTYFSEINVSAEEGTAVELQLAGTGYASGYSPVSGPCEGAQIYVDGAVQTGVMTDSDGKVSLTFDTAGTYVVTAWGVGKVGTEESFITPAYCKVTVSAPTTTPVPTPEPTPVPTPEPTPTPTPEPAPAPTFPAVDKTMAEIPAASVESCSSYMSGLYGTELTYGYEWYVYNMLRAGKTFSAESLDKYYESVKTEVSEWEATQKPTDIARTALALSAMGKDITDVGGVNLAAMLYNHPSLDAGSNELAYALLALDARNTAIPEGAKWTREAIVNKLLTYQNTSDGGFGLFDNQTTSVDMTAIVVQAIAPYKSQNAAVAQAADLSVQYFKNKMSANYDFDSNSNTTAVVVLALTSLGIDPANEANGFGTADNNVITALYGYRVVNGAGYTYMLGGNANAYATVQAMQAFNAYKMLVGGEGAYWKWPEIKPEVKVDENVNTGDATPVKAMTLLCMAGLAGLIFTVEKKKQKLL